MNSSEDHRFKNYLTMSGSNGIKLVIMGKDPYPRDQCYVPFCKPEWNQQISENYSGIAILKSIGVQVDGISTRFNKPVDLFLSLREQGIVFLNLSYDFIGERITKGRDIQKIEDAYEINKTILKLADNVVLCGEAKKLEWLESLSESRYHCAIHPDQRNRINPKRRERWHMWWDANALGRKFDIQIAQ